MFGMDGALGTGLDGITLGAWGLTVISLWLLWMCVLAYAEARHAKDPYGWLVVSLFGILALVEFSLGVALYGTLAKSALHTLLLWVWVGGLLIVSGLLGFLWRRPQPGERRIGLFLAVFAVFMVSFSAFVWNQ